MNTICEEKLRMFMSSSKFINQETQMKCLVIVDRNNTAVHLTRTDSEGF